MEGVLLILNILTLACLAVLLIRQFSEKRANGGAVTNEKIDGLSKIASDGFAEIRRGTRESGESLRLALSGSLESVGGRMDKISESAADSQLNVVKSLADMREKLDAAGRVQTQALTSAIEKMQLSNEKKLDEMRLTVDEKLTSTLRTRLDASFKSVSDQLSNVYKSLGEMKELTNGVTALNRIFTNVKIRGNWAEAQLEGILDRVIPGMYVKNYHSGGQNDIVEFAVKIPDSNGNKTTYLPIDSKFPTEDYLRLCDAADNGDTDGVRTAKKALEARVLGEAKTVNKYINPPETTPFAILYLATDSLYAEIVSSKENIADRLHNEYGVLLTGPSTITALLSSLAMGLRTVALNQKASEVMDLLAAAKTQYDKFGEALEKAKKKINEAGQSLEDAQKRNSIIVKRLRGVETVTLEGAAETLQLGELEE